MALHTPQTPQFLHTYTAVYSKMLKSYPPFYLHRQYQSIVCLARTYPHTVFSKDQNLTLFLVVPQ